MFSGARERKAKKVAQRISKGGTKRVVVTRATTGPDAEHLIPIMMDMGYEAPTVQPASFGTSSLTFVKKDA